MACRQRISQTHCHVGGIQQGLQLYHCGQEGGGEKLLKKQKGCLRLYKSCRWMMNSQVGKTQALPGEGNLIWLGVWGVIHSVPYPLNMISHFTLPKALWGACLYSHHFIDEKSQVSRELKELSNHMAKNDPFWKDLSRRPVQLPLWCCSSMTWMELSGGRWTTWYPPVPLPFRFCFPHPFSLPLILPPSLLSF